MRYRCNCPEYEERPCDNPNEELECEECQHGKPEEEAEMCRAAIKLHEEQIGDCSTCVNLDRSMEPGFVTDYGGCRMGKAFFAEKACGLVDHVCDGYTEERGLVEWAEARLAELA